MIFGAHLIIAMLRYHHHMTRGISSALISSVWVISCLSCVPSLLLPVPSTVWHTCSLHPPRVTTISLLVSLTITLVTVLVPTIVLAIIYCHIYSEAHTSSAKNRKSSLKPASNESIYCIASTVVGPLGVSQAQLLGASRIQNANRLAGNIRKYPDQETLGNIRKYPDQETLGNIRTAAQNSSSNSRRGSVAALAKLGRTASVPVLRHRLGKQ